MSIHFVVTTYNRPAELVRCVVAALASDIEVEVTVIDNSPSSYARSLLHIDDCLQDAIDIVTLPRSIGWGPSINLAFALYDDYIICCNDDVQVHPHTVRELVGAADDFPQDMLFYGAHDGSSMFSLFLLRKQAYLEMGPFDPTLCPLHYEDIDAIRRLHLLGYEPNTVYPATYEHLKNGTVKALSPEQKELFDRQFYRNERQFVKKWGGHKFEEVYELPYNGLRPVVEPFITE